MKLTLCKRTVISGQIVNEYVWIFCKEPKSLGSQIQYRYSKRNYPKNTVAHYNPLIMTFNSFVVNDKKIIWFEYNEDSTIFYLPKMK